MCTRTKTSYGCGHASKTDVRCKDSHNCPGLERFHFQRPGDCADCRGKTESLKRSGLNPTADRGRKGLGRYGKILQGKSAGYNGSDDEEDRYHGVEDEQGSSGDEPEYEVVQRSRAGRGRDTTDKVATGAAEESARSAQQRKALRQLRQQQSPQKYNVVPSQPLRPSLRSYETAPPALNSQSSPLFAEIPPSSHVNSSRPRHAIKTSSPRAPSTKSSSYRYDTGFTTSHPTHPSSSYSHSHSYNHVSPIYAVRAPSHAHSTTHPRHSSSRPHPHSYSSGHNHGSRTHRPQRTYHNISPQDVVVEVASYEDDRYGYNDRYSDDTDGSEEDIDHHAAHAYIEERKPFSRTNTAAASRVATVREIRPRPRPGYDEGREWEWDGRSRKGGRRGW